MPSQKLGKHEHLLRPQDFRLVFERRCSVSDDWLCVFLLPNGLGWSRLGLSVGKKFGGAVQRNRIRRVYREAFRLARPELPTGWDIVLVPRTAKPPTTAVIRECLVKLVRRRLRSLQREASCSAPSPP